MFPRFCTKKNPARPETALAVAGTKPAAAKKFSWLFRGIKELFFMLFVTLFALSATFYFLFQVERATLAVGGFAQEKQILSVRQTEGRILLEVFGRHYELFLK